MIDYRHLLPAFKRKPGALARSVLRDALFPRTEYRQMWEKLKEQLPEAGGCEAALAQRLMPLLAAGALPDLEHLRHELAPRPGLYPSVTVGLPELASYDRLLEAA